ncbi:dihydrolipoamide acetyltransferase family protein [Candidatus Karelsulcia muelleri]
MAEIIYMPRLSDTMKEGTIVKWYKQVGEKVLEGEILAEIETDKAIQEFESEYNATLLYIGVKEGEKAKINEMLAILGETNEKIDDLINKNNLLVSPLAKQMALEEGIKLKNIKGSGPNNRIVKKDILKIIKNDNKTDENISQIRKIISERLLRSKQISPHYYLFLEIHADNLIKFKKYINKNSMSKISFNDLIVKATALSLQNNQKINSSWKKERISYHKDINLGIAVSLPEGLMVPVIHTVETKSLRTLSKEIKEKVERCRNKKISPKELEGSTFTISNLGMFGIDCFTSIINQPNSSILSVGSIQRKTIIDKNKIKIGHTIQLTLACDHRIIDGAVGSAFLLTLKEYLLEPITMLI